MQTSLSIPPSPTSDTLLLCCLCYAVPGDAVVEAMVVRPFHHEPEYQVLLRDLASSAPTGGVHPRHPRAGQNV